MEDIRNACNILVRKPEGKRLLGRHRHGLEGNMRMNHRNIMCKAVSLILLAEDGGPVMDCHEHCNEILSSIKSENFLDQLSYCWFSKEKLATWS
jgi:hypothetical protein